MSTIEFSWGKMHMCVCTQHKLHKNGKYLTFNFFCKVKQMKRQGSGKNYNLEGDIYTQDFSKTSDM